jgi:hypothetical protein
MDYQTNAVWYHIRWEHNDSQWFMDDVMDAIVDGFLVEVDVLVLVMLQSTSEGRMTRWQIGYGRGLVFSLPFF